MKSGIWVKSRRSMSNGNCVEVRWRKSSGSYGSGNCLEAGNAPAGVLVRDTKNRGGPVLAYSAKAWRVFTDGLKRGAS